MTGSVLQDAYACDHADSELRHRRVSNGIRYAHQCLRCGRIAGNWIKHSDVSAFPPAWDEDLNTRFSASVRATLNQKWEEGKADRRAEYARYLASQEWREKRRRVLERDRFVCQGCGEQKATEVHHVSYERKGREMLFDLVSLCGACHRQIHEDEAA